MNQKQDIYTRKNQHRSIVPINERKQASCAMDTVETSPSCHFPPPPPVSGFVNYVNRTYAGIYSLHHEGCQQSSEQLFPSSSLKSPHALHGLRIYAGHQSTGRFNRESQRL